MIFLRVMGNVLIFTSSAGKFTGTTVWRILLKIVYKDKINAVSRVPANLLNFTKFYIAICRRGRGLGLHKSTVFYMVLPAL